MSTIDPATMAQQLATYDIQGFQTRYTTQQTEYEDELEALNNIETALEAFQTAVNEMNTSTSTVLKNSATVSEEGYFTASADANALSGSYQVFVQQVATAHQMSIGMPDTLTSDTEIPATGSLDFSMNGESLSIDLSAIDANGDGINTVSELVNAINNADENPGINATLVRSDGITHFMLSSTETGTENSITATTNGTGETWFEDAIASQTDITVPQDAIIWLGAENTGLQLSNSSNTFSNVIDGVDLTVTKVQTSGDASIATTIEIDEEGSKEQINNLINAYNTLISTIDKYTGSGDEDTDRGILANDSMIRSVENRINSLFRSQYEGSSLMDIGLSIDRNGKLTLDSDRFEEAQKNNSATLEAMFNGDGNLFDSIDDVIEPFVKFSTGLFSSRKDSIEQNIDRIDDKLEILERKYNTSYQRYLTQFTYMNSLITQMDQTSSLFSV
ncbi:flagellar hook-associated protein [Vibrio sp. HA2012]|uniref:flagellar filament capping protein FliD n=1 Tax=Vibrio sp. HA2012 TaxID=1971595 RepID=UPI000C2BCB5A|nr:flagellar filament capping protein FliD [Vibrio sp. HA2012]PJC86429.1 flagellar hook-associated protein [Vibrio sp. HA2012]